MVVPASHEITRASRYSGYQLSIFNFCVRDFYPLWSTLSNSSFCFVNYILCRSTTPKYLRISVWASPLSLATTYGITFVFFSYGYLDVSVPRVSPVYTMYSLSLIHI